MKGKSASERRRSRSRDYLADIERDWRLVLHDDVLHRIDEVEEILARVSHAIAIRRSRR